MNIPLNAITFSDILPAPVTWAFQPYNLSGLSISNPNINGNSATFLIDEIAANTVATFSMDAALNDWTTAGSLDNTATLSNVLDLLNGGLQSLSSNSVSTQINVDDDIQIEWSANCAAVDLNAFLESAVPDTWEWQSLGDGIFTDSLNANTIYTPGTQDLIDDSFFILLKVQSDCEEVNKIIEIIIEEPTPIPLELATCEGTTIVYEGVSLNVGDNMEFTLENHLGCDSIVAVGVIALPNDATDLVLETCENTSISYQGTELYVGDIQAFTFQNIQGCDSIVTVTVNGQALQNESLTFEVCAGESVEYNGTWSELGESSDFLFTDQNGCDSTVSVSVIPLAISEESLVLETCLGEPVNYQDSLLNAGEEATFIFENYLGCDSIVFVSVEVGGDREDFGIPNVFTPNGDGINDCFGLVNLNDTAFETFDLQIFNRWGKLVFSTSNPADCWNGEINGEAATADVYAYVLQAATVDCAVEILEMGDLSLVR